MLLLNCPAWPCLAPAIHSFANIGRSADKITSRIPKVQTDIEADRITDEATKSWMKFTLQEDSSMGAQLAAASDLASLAALAFMMIQPGALLSHHSHIQGREIMKLSLVTDVPSGPIGSAWAGHFAWQK